MIPCAAGGIPKDREVSAVAVVVGATELIGPPIMLVRFGARRARDWSCSQPKPSRTSKTTCAAPRKRVPAASRAVLGGQEQRRRQGVEAGATVGREDEASRVTRPSRPRPPWSTGPRTGPVAPLVQLGGRLARHFRTLTYARAMGTMAHTHESAPGSQ